MGEYRKGYFMNREEEQAARGKLFLDFKEADHRLGLLRAQAAGLAKQIESIAGALKTKPESLSSSNVEALVDISVKMGKAIEDIKATIEEVNTLASQVRASGLDHLIR